MAVPGSRERPDDRADGDAARSGRQAGTPEHLSSLDAAIGAGRLRNCWWNADISIRKIATRSSSWPSGTSTGTGTTSRGSRFAHDRWSRLRANLAELGDPDVTATVAGSELTVTEFDPTHRQPRQCRTVAVRRAAVPRPQAPRPGRPGCVSPGARLGTEPRGRPQADPRSPRRQSRQPPAVPDRGRGHRRPGASGHRAGLRHGHLPGRPALLRHAIHPGRFPQAGDRELSRARASDHRPLELRKLLRRFLDVCNAIHYAHSRGVLHRDIKPSNIIVGKYGETLVVDWGLAKATGKTEPQAGEHTLIPAAGSGSSETQPGSALGTPAYMSPEQAAGRPGSARPPVRRLRPGRHALPPALRPARRWRETTPSMVIQAVIRGEIKPLRLADPTIDPALESVCLKAMALKPEDRYASARELADDIERWMADEPVTGAPGQPATAPGPMDTPSMPRRSPASAPC